LRRSICQEERVTSTRILTACARGANPAPWQLIERPPPTLSPYTRICESQRVSRFILRPSSGRNRSVRHNVKILHSFLHMSVDRGCSHIRDVRPRARKRRTLDNLGDAQVYKRKALSEVHPCRTVASVKFGSREHLCTNDSERRYHLQMTEGTRTRAGSVNAGPEGGSVVPEVDCSRATIENASQGEEPTSVLIRTRSSSNRRTERAVDSRSISKEATRVK